MYNTIMKMYEKRKEELEMMNEIDKEIIKKNGINDITQEELEKIIECQKINDKNKKEIKNMINKYIENNWKFNEYQCRKYYIAGLQDAINIENLKNKEIRKITQFLTLDL